MEYPESELMNYVFHGCPKLHEKKSKCLNINFA
jgi:hypothetical protein